MTENDYITEIRNVRDVLDRGYLDEVRGLVILLQGINSVEDKTLKQFLYDNIDMEKETHVKEAVDAMSDFYLETEKITIRPEWEEMLLNEAPARFMRVNYNMLKKNDCVEYLPRFACHHGKILGKKNLIRDVIKIENHVIVKVRNASDDKIIYYVSMRDEYEYKSIFRNIESLIFDSVEKAMLHLAVGDDFFDSANLMRKEYEKRMENKD